MPQLFRLFAFVLFLLSSTRVFALDEVDRFAKKCDLFHGQKDFFEDPKRYYRKQTVTLKRAAVPIRLSFDTCKLEYIIQLKNGTTTVVEHSYPTNADPDNKGTTNHWNPKSPSKKYWYFESGGWEWGGFVLVEKATGRQIKETSECGYHQMKLRGKLLAIVCGGNYENIVPAFYVVDFSKKELVWSNPIPLNTCQEHDAFVPSQFEFTSPKDFHIAGECQARDYFYSEREKTILFKIQRREKIKSFNVRVDSNGLSANVKGRKTKVTWKFQTQESN